MKSFDKLIAAFFAAALVLFVGVNIILTNRRNESEGLYKVEINRLVRDIEAGGEVSADKYDTILGFYEYDGTDDFYNSRKEYVIRKINNKIYRIEYSDIKSSSVNKMLMAVNLAILIFTFLTASILFYIRRNIIKPFNELSELPYELSKGNLTAGLKENKNRYFGKFVWGLDMLREELENAKKQRLEQAKREKTLVLSLSHDIKTPLSAVKLYAGALTKGIYSDKQKQLETAERINAKADEIEELVNRIMKDFGKDFSDFKVEHTEFYLSKVITDISEYYVDKLSALSMEFSVMHYHDCMICGDPERLVEVLQNIIENAIKYGDGISTAISFSDEEGCRLITIKNSGCTLPETELAHIFDSFWRGSNSSNINGSGLGLYICRRLMNAMGGDIFAEISDGSMSVTVVCKKV